MKDHRIRNLCIASSLMIVLILSCFLEDPRTNFKLPPYKSSTVTRLHMYGENHSANAINQSKSLMTFAHGNNLTNCKISLRDSSNFPSTNVDHKELLPQSVDNITDAKFTRVTVLKKKNVYRLCDRIYVIIEARDSLNRPKQYGGDMFRVKLFSSKPYAAVNADQMIDFQNGTYLAIFRILWEAKIGLHILLVHPAEAVPLFLPTLNGSRINTDIFKAGFVASDDSGQKHEERTTCTLTEREINACNFSDTEIYAPWYCSAPKDKFLNCSHWTTYIADKKAMNKALQRDFNPMAKEILERSKTVVYSAPGLFNVEQVDNDTTHHFAQLMRPTLPYCKAEGPPPLYPNGYFYGDLWYPNDCKVDVFSSEDALECLEDKTLRFFGDSTGRQFYDYLRTLTSCNPLPLDPPRKDSRLEFRCRVNNMSLHFNFHGVPTQGSSVLPAAGMHYAAHEIDSLKGGSNTIIFLSYWAHFTQTGEQFYLKRLQTVKDAIDRLLQRYPETRIFMKGANTRNYSVQIYQLISSDWIAFEFEKILRTFYMNYTNFGYIDTWDVTQPQGFADNVHPQISVIKNFVNRLLTYICRT